MFQGLRTAIYRVGDLARAKEWYATALDTQPYFDEPFYVGFEVGGFELGLLPKESGAANRSDTGVTVYWGVDDADAAHERLLASGALEREGVQDVGDDIRVATVTDPFGNVFGIIENPHFTLDSA